jgi:hypothetical protein
MTITLENFFNMMVEAEYLLLCLFFSYTFRKRKHFCLRLIVLSILFIGISFLTQSIDTGNVILSYAINFIIVFLSGFLFLFLLYNNPVQSSIFLAVLSYSYRHIIYLLWQLLSHLLNDFTKLDMGSFSYWWIILAIVSVLAYIPLGIYLFKRIKDFPDIALPRTRIILTSSLSLLITIVLNNFTLYYGDVKSLPSLQYVLNVFSFVSTSMIIMLLIGNAKEVSLKNEIQAINQLRYQEEKQYRMSKESIDLINIKCHDLRHQIRSLKNSGKAISQEELSQIEDAIRIYDTRVKTGNTSLDFILQEKSLICQKNHITFDYIIDGQQISFMKENDIYSLFGNVIDNGIEGCLKLEKSEERNIRLKIKSAANGVIFVEENPYYGNLTLKDGLPVSTKGDVRYHGFGMKSIAHIVNTYHGTMRISTNDNIFTISIFFPKNK